MDIRRIIARWVKAPLIPSRYDHGKPLADRLDAYAQHDLQTRQRETGERRLTKYAQHLRRFSDPGTDTLYGGITLFLPKPLGTKPNSK